MAELTPAQRQIADQMISRTFSDPAMQTQGWGQPTGNAPRQGTVNTPYLRQGASGVRFNPGDGFVPGAIPRDRLPQGTAGLPGPAGSGITPQQWKAIGGWTVDPRTGQLAYAQPSAQNPAVAAATQQGQGVAPPFPRPPIARWNYMDAVPQRGANPGMGGAMIGNGVMAPGIPPQGPPPPGIAPTVWAGGGAPAARPAAPIMRPAEAYALKNLAGQQAALGRQATATGTAGGWNYVNGQRTGTVGGVSPAAAYDRAAAAARQSSPDNGGNPSWW